MSLPADQQSLLDGMDRALAARDPRLASMFAAFTLLTSDDCPPNAERLAAGPGRFAVLLRAGGRAVQATAAIPIVLAAGLMAAIVAIGLATSGWSACSTASPGPPMRAGIAVCGSSAGGSAK